MGDGDKEKIKTVLGSCKILRVRRRSNSCYFKQISAIYVKNVKNGPYHPFLEFLGGIKEWRAGFFILDYKSTNKEKYFSNFFFFKISTC